MNLVPQPMPGEPFKILAIQPKKGCLENYLKVLNVEQTYYLYQNITIKNDILTEHDPLPNDFYKESRPHIEINAIAGKNGSGKSTITDLAFMAINNLACGDSEMKKQVVWLKGVHVWVYFQAQSHFYKIVADEHAAKLFCLDKKSKTMEEKININFDQFFYTIAINFSHYAFNELDYPKDQNWLSGVFHKNDGYRVPINLNPYRERGGINMIRENQLVKARIMANIFKPSTDKDFNFRQISEKLTATWVELKLNRAKSKGVIYKVPKQKTEEFIEYRLSDLDIKREPILEYLNRIYPFNYNEHTIKENALAIDYLIFKLVSICTKYREYEKYYNKGKQAFREHMLEDFLDQVIKDPSHITYKVKQTLNHIRFGFVTPRTKKLNLERHGKKIYDAFSDLANTHIGELIELLPPPFYRPELIVRSKLTGRESPFSGLSSGEKQLNYSVSTVLYHLNNLDSVPADGRRIKYHNVFLVLDEVELYYHPQMQRNHIKHLLQTITQLHLKTIQQIHICFITHSPFILSDIPDQNILFLDDNGLPEAAQRQIQTFGANIHELFKEAMFLSGGLIGDFAKQKIDDIIDWCGTGSHKNQHQAGKMKQIAQLVGEPIIRAKLLEMIARKMGEDGELARLEEQQRYIQQRIQELRDKS